MTAPSALLRQYPPFDRLEAESLAFLDTHLKPAQFAAEALLISPEQGEPLALYRGQGKVRAIEANGNGSWGSRLTLSVGECFPIGARRSRPSAISMCHDRSRCICCRPGFPSLMAISPAFTRYCSGYLASLVGQSRKQCSALLAASQRAAFAHTPLIELIKAGADFGQFEYHDQRGVEIMGEHKTGSVIVVNGDSAPSAMTQSDVVRRVVLGKCRSTSRSPKSCRHPAMR
jgi:signal-transduction protein with cAMP-binding, CBS, and nucleotidyltransferase domain